jgi:hypothetical protein
VASRFLAFDPARTAEDYERLQEQELDRMVDDGDITPRQRTATALPHTYESVLQARSSSSGLA